MPEDIRVDEWLAELERLSVEAQAAGDDGAVTTRELCAVWECCEKTARKRLRKLHADGRLEAVKAPRAALDGETRRVAAYRLKQASGKIRKASRAP